MESTSVVQMLTGKLLEKEAMTPKQRAVLEAAIELFAEKGFASTSTSEIAKKAGVAEGTIFKYFGTKEKLLYSSVLPVLLEDLFPIQADIFREAVLEKEHLHFEQFIDTLIKDRFAFLKENTQLIKIFFTELMYREEMKEVLLATFTDKVANALDDVLGRMKEKQMIVDWDNVLIMRTIIVQLLGYIVPRFFIFPERDWDDEKELTIVKQMILKILLP